MKNTITYYRIVLVLAALIVEVSCSLIAQRNQRPNRSLTIEKGLSQSSVTAIKQDKRGFIWLGTYDGLNRYDGQQITVFSAKENSNKHISAGTILDIEEDAERDLIYIGTSGGGLNVFDPTKEIFKHFKHTDDDNSILSDFIVDIEIIPSGDVWMATNLGISCYSPESNTFTNYEASRDSTSGFPYASAVSLAYSSSGILWVGTYGEGLVRYDLKTKAFKTYKIQMPYGNQFNQNVINDIELAYDGNLLIASDGGLFQFNIENEQFQAYQLHHGVAHIIQGSENDYWVAVRERGLRHIQKDGSITEYVHDEYDSKSIPEDFIYSIYLDDRNHLWVGMKNKGLWQLQLNAKPFKNYYHVPGQKSLFGSSVFAIEQDAYNDVWIGTQEGLTKWNIETNAFAKVEIWNDEKMQSVWALFYEAPNKLWIGTSYGLVQYNIRTGQSVIYSHNVNDPNSLSNDEVFAIEKDKNGRLWIGTNYGLNLFLPESNEFKRYLPFATKTALSHPTIWNIECDAKGQLWICTAEGLNLYHEETDNFTVYKHIEGDSLSLSDSYVNSIKLDQYDQYWVATRQGINVLNEDKAVVKTISKKDGLNNDFIYRFLEHDDYIWASTNNGLSRINTKDFRIENFNVSDGLNANEFNNAALKLMDEQFVFGSIEGITVFHSDSIHLSNYVPPIYFTGLKLYEQEISPRDTSSWHDIVIKTSLINAKHLKLSPRERIVTLEFSALDFDGPDRIDYFYRLLPNTKNWIPLHNKNFLTFINLNPGRYRLEIKSTNADGLICDNVRSIKIEVKPPLWKETWFVIMEFIFLFFFIYLLVRYRMHRLKRDKERLESVVEMRTKEIEVQRNVAHQQRDEIARQKKQLEEFAKGLEEKVKDRTRELEKEKVKAEESDRLKSAFLSNMSHEIRTPMNAIIGFSELLLEPSFEEKEKLGFAKMIKTNGDTLLSLLSDIIDISMIESGQLKINKSPVRIQELVEAVHTTFINTSVVKDKKEVELFLNCQIEDLVIQTDPIRLTQILNNLLSNAVKFTEKGSVKLECRLINPKWVEFSVEDTGIGIDTEFQKKIFDRFLKVDEDKNNLYRGSGLGLTITKNLVELLGGIIGLQSEKGKGSRFFFKLPYRL